MAADAGIAPRVFSVVIGPARLHFSFCVMMRLAISRFVGTWVTASGHRLRIRRVLKDKASVDFLDSCGKPVRRAFMGGAPSLGMAAHYDDYDDEFEVELWGPQKGFTLHLAHEEAYPLDKHQREALVPGISRYEEDRFLDAFYPLFGRLEHFVRERDAEPCAPVDAPITSQLHGNRPRRRATEHKRSD